MRNPIRLLLCALISVAGCDASSIDPGAADMRRVRDLGLNEKCFILVGVGPLASAKTARWRGSIRLWRGWADVPTKIRRPHSVLASASFARLFSPPWWTILTVRRHSLPVLTRCHLR